jgi:hypothetical protein
VQIQGWFRDFFKAVPVLKKSFQLFKRLCPLFDMQIGSQKILTRDRNTPRLNPGRFQASEAGRDGVAQGGAV